MMDSEYMNRIRKRRDIVRSKTPNFPFMACTESALDLQDNLGFVYVMGSYGGNIDDKYREDLARFIKGSPNKKSVREYWDGLTAGFNNVLHSFNYDPTNRNFVDMTASQFDSSLDDIIVISRDDSRVSFLTKLSTPKTTHSVRSFIVGSRSSGELRGWGIKPEVLLNEGIVVPYGYE